MMWALAWAVPVSWSYLAFRTQCFTRRAFSASAAANETTLLQASPETLKEAAEILDQQHARNEPVVVRSGPGRAALGWAPRARRLPCWSPACLEEELGAVPIEALTPQPQTLNP